MFSYIHSLCWKIKKKLQYLYAEFSCIFGVYMCILVHVYQGLIRLLWQYTVRLQFTVQYSVTTTKEMYVCASVSIDKRIDTNSDITHAHITSDFMWKMVKFMRSQRFFVKQSTEVEKPSKSL